MVRIIAGKAKGRLLKIPRGSKIRPTSDKVRESLFNIIGPSSIRGARFMDLFAGAGAIGIEALSRGAQYVTFAESSARHAKTIRENLGLCGFLQSSEVVCADVISAVDRLYRHRPPYNIVFIDPPYSYPSWKILLSKITKNVNICSYGFLIIEHSTKVSVPDSPENMMLYGRYIYGDTTLTVYRKIKEK